jgi:hypothetical protein
MRLLCFFSVFGAIVLGHVTALAQTPAPRNDYSKPETWLCRPGGQDACAVDLSTTVVAADGRMTREAFTPNPSPSIDCFYVYPTVSLDPGGNSDMTPGAEERNCTSSTSTRRWATSSRSSDDRLAPIRRRADSPLVRG